MSTPVQTVTVPTELAGLRLDAALPRLYPEFSRAKLQLWLTQGHILVNGQAHILGKTKVHGHETIELWPQAEVTTVWEGEDLPLDIIYEDEALMVINKPAGLVTHPAVSNRNHTLINAVLFHCPQNQRLPRGGIVHRLDKDTTGLLLIAKTPESLQYLVDKLSKREITREYRALVRGEVISGGTVDAPLGRHPKDRLKQAVIASGRTAQTHYRVLQRFRGYTLLQLHLATGRTHQIRVHMSHIGYPIVGDKTYGGLLLCPPKTSDEVKHCLQQFKRQALHAYRLSFIHPLSQQEHRFSAPLPDDFRQLLTLLEQYHHALDES
jgi:23S rRNA pseudouridine1911/1915/1917 synthase